MGHDHTPSPGALSTTWRKRAQFLSDFGDPNSARLWQLAAGGGPPGGAHIRWRGLGSYDVSRSPAEANLNSLRCRGLSLVAPEGPAGD